MKKVSIVSLILVSVLATGAFAQVSFSGEIHAGIQLQRDGVDDAAFGTYHREEGSPRFDFTATVLRENYGARLDTTFRMPSDGEGDLTINGIYGWVDFDGFLEDDSIRLTMGQINSTPWVLPRFLPRHSEVKFGDVRGFRVEYATPIEGLSVGAAFRADGHDVQRFAEQMIFGANFVHPLFTAVFAYDLSNNVQTLFGFNFMGIPDLTASFQLRGTRLASWDDDAAPFGFPGELQMYYKVGYRIMRPLFVYLVFGQRFHGVSDMGPYWEITPGVTYRILPDLVGEFRVTLDNFEGNPNKNLTITTALEHTLRGPAILYVEYEVSLPNMESNRVIHTFGFGITIRAF